MTRHASEEVQSVSEHRLRLSVPPHLRRGALKSNEMASVASGLALLELVEGIRPITGATILDFGCGVKITQALLERNVPQKKYVGLDVYKKMIAFLKDNCKDPHFEFHIVDFHNDMYNPTGEKMTPSSMLPIADQTFDIMTMFSVITHMVPADAMAILAILRKYAHQDTRLVFSTFVDDEQEVEFYDWDPQRPLFKAKYRKEYLQSIIGEASWNILEYRPEVKGVIADHYICNPQ